MAAPGKAPRPQAGGAARAGGAKRDKGTRGGRPEPGAVRPQSMKPQRKQTKSARNATRLARTNLAQAETPAAAPAADRTAPAGWGWVKRRPLEFVTLLLAVAGLGVSTYLTVIHYTDPTGLYCSDTGLVNCTKVTTSPESVVLGIPVAVLGLAFYLFMVAATSPWAWRWQQPALRWARLGSVIVGMVFVLYLIYTELFTLDAICLWCTSVHVITFVLFGLIVFTTAAGDSSRREA